MTSIEGAGTEYQFPLSQDDLARLGRLKNALTKSKTNDAIEALHDLFKHIFYPRSFPGSTENLSKWNSPFECLMAVYNLKEDGNFNAAKDVTQMFAQIHYHIRGSILYEAVRHKAKFDHNLVK
jgi:hypothetical protein